MSDEGQLIRLTANVEHLQSDMTEVKEEIRTLRGGLEDLKGQFLSFKAEVAREFGSVRISIERAKLWMIATGNGTILSVWGAALALARFLKP